MAEGGKVYACRFSTQALYGHGEAAFIEGIRMINPLDVLDCILLHKRDNAVIIDTGPSDARTAHPAAARRGRRLSRRISMSENRIVRAAAVQIAPDLDRPDGTLERVLNAIDEAAAKGARFMVFPETFVPYYPYFSFVLPPPCRGRASQAV